MFSRVVIVRTNKALGPKPRKKRTLLDNEKGNSESPPKVPEVSSVNVEAVGDEENRLKEADFDVDFVSVKEEDDVKEFSNNYDNGEVVAVEEKEPEYETEEEYYPEEDCEPEEEYDPEEDCEPEDFGCFCFDKKEFECTNVHEGDEFKIEAEDNAVDEEGEGVGSLSAENVLEEEMEDVADEIEDDEDDDTPGYVEEDKMVDAYEVLKGRHEEKKFEVFIGGLDKDATKDDIRKVFSEVGKITDIRLIMNPLTKKNKGFAFLRFATVEQANRALTELRNPVVNGKLCGVSPFNENNTLFVGNICKRWTQEILEKKLKYFGVEKYDYVTLVEDTNDVGMNRGFAFLEFSSHSDAVNAYKQLRKRDVLLGVGRCAKVSFAYPSIETGNRIITQVKRVFLDGIPASWDLVHVKECMKKFGRIEKIELARYKPLAKRKDFGFVTFDSHEAAVACAETINNSVLIKGNNKVKVKAILSQPAQTRKWRHLVHGNFRVSQAPTSAGVRDHPTPRDIPMHLTREIRPCSKFSGGRGLKGSGGCRDGQPGMAKSGRDRPNPPVRSYDKKLPVFSYPKNIMKRHCGRQSELASSRPAVEFGPNGVETYKSGRSSWGSEKSDVSLSRARSGYLDKANGRRSAKPFSSHSQGHAREYDSFSGSKRQYSGLDDVPPCFFDTRVRQSRSHLDYEVGGKDSQYGNAYSKRVHLDHEIGGKDSHYGNAYSSRACWNYEDGESDSQYGNEYSKRAHLDHEIGGKDSHYGNAYSSRACLDYEYAENESHYGNVDRKRAHLDYEIVEKDSHYGNAYCSRGCLNYEHGENDSQYGNVHSKRAHLDYEIGEKDSHCGNAYSSRACLDYEHGENDSHYENVHRNRAHLDYEHEEHDYHHGNVHRNISNLDYEHGEKDFHYGYAYSNRGSLGYEGGQHCGDAYNNRPRSSHRRFGGSSRYLPRGESRELRCSGQDMDYGEGSFGDVDHGGLSSTIYDEHYLTNVRVTTYSSHSSHGPIR